VIAPLEVNVAVAQQPTDDGERLLEPLDPMVEGVAEGPVFGFVPAGPQAEDQASATDLVDRCRLLRQHGRVVERGAGHQRAQLHALGHRGQGRQCGPGFPRTPIRFAGIPVQQVVADPQGVEPNPFRGASHVPKLRPAHHALDLGELNADAKRAGHASLVHRPSPRFRHSIC
jgi:hypothetical protein